MTLHREKGSRLITCKSSIALLTLLFAASCSTTKKEEIPTAAPQLAQAQTAPTPAPKPAAKGVGESSLEQLQKGGVAPTPASSALKDIYFDFDKYDLDSNARDILKTNAEWMKSNPAARVEIEGHCDERGTTEYNIALGAKRAQAAKDYLVTLGIPAQQLSTISYGKELQVCQEHTEDCWRQNRHDRFVAKNTPTA